MPETKDQALARAKREGFLASSIRKGEKGYYIIPHGITDDAAQRAYIHCRDSGGESSVCAAVAHSLQTKQERDPDSPVG